MFETVLRLSAPRSSRTGRRLFSLPVSIVLHGLAIGAAALLSGRTVAEAPEPPVRVVFMEGSAPPALEEDRELTSGETRLRTREAVQEQPIEAPSKVESSARPREDESGRDAASPSEAASGDREGSGEGEPSGLPGSAGREGLEAGDSERPLRPGGNVAEPRLLYRVEPLYPETARKARLDGTVVLQAIISGSGNVESIQVVQSVNPLLDAEAVHAVERWRYRPATLNGRPVLVYLTVSVEFRLR